jgi:lipopolysaccharide export system ATP-binding protein
VSPATLAGARLIRRFGARAALAGVDLAVSGGEVVGLLGPNGAGKSTCFRILAGLDTPDSGQVQLDGTEITRWPLHRRARAGIGYLPQHPSLIPQLTAAENVAVAGVTVVEARRRLAEAGLGAIADRPAGFLSGGERRRVELARTIALGPRVLLLDEPFAGVDPLHVREIEQAVRALARRGLAILLTDHQVRDALPLCDRALVLDEGVVRVVGTPAVVASDPTARSRYLGDEFRLEPR